MRFLFLCIVLIFGGLAGCHRTQLAAPPASGNHARIAAMASEVLQLKVSSLADAKLGNQYLFVLIPFGALSHPELAQHVMNRSAERLAEISIQAAPQCGSCPILEITVSDASLSAFDLFFTRRVRASIVLRARLSGTNLPDWEGDVTGSYSAFRLAPFKAELEYAMDQAIRDGINQLLETAPLHLSRSLGVFHHGGLEGTRRRKG